MRKYIIFIGIDISKKWFDACLCLNGNIKDLPHKRFDQTQKGYQSLLDWVAKQAKQNNLEGAWKFCLEHTGIYSLSLSHFLEERQQAYILENPLRIKLSSGLKRGKTDQSDAQAIAIYAWRHQDQLHKHRPLPNLLLIKVQALLSLRSRLVRYRHGLQVASGELEACVATNISQLVVNPTAVIIDSMDAEIKKIMEQLIELINSDSELKRIHGLVSSVIGIGDVIAAHLLVYTNGFTAFDNARQFANYVGVVPFKHKSGTSIQAPDKTSNVANHKMKTLLSNAATVAVRWDPQIKAFFHRQLANGKEEGWIYNAVKNKLIHRIFKVVKRGTPYVKLAH